MDLALLNVEMHSLFNGVLSTSKFYGMQKYAEPDVVLRQRRMLSFLCQLLHINLIFKDNEEDDDGVAVINLDEKERQIRKPVMESFILIKADIR